MHAALMAYDFLGSAKPAWRWY